MYSKATPIIRVQKPYVNRFSYSFCRLFWKFSTASLISWSGASPNLPQKIPADSSFPYPLRDPAYPRRPQTIHQALIGRPTQKNLNSAIHRVEQLRKLIRKISKEDIFHRSSAHTCWAHQRKTAKSIQKNKHPPSKANYLPKTRTKHVLKMFTNHKCAQSVVKITT